MHSYSRERPERKQLQLWLMLIAVAGTFLLAPVVSSLQVPEPVKLLFAPTALLIYGALFAAYNRFLWRVGRGSLGLSGIPDLNGAWVGLIVTDFGDRTHASRNYLAVATIRQTWSSIRVELHTPFSRSESLMAVMLGPRDSPSLRYEYHCWAKEPIPAPTSPGAPAAPEAPVEASVDPIPLIREHRGVGAVSVERDAEGLLFEGSYYTDSDSGSQQHVGCLRQFRRISRAHADYFGASRSKRLRKKIDQLVTTWKTDDHLAVDTGHLPPRVAEGVIRRGWKWARSKR